MIHKLSAEDVSPAELDLLRAHIATVPASSPLVPFLTEMADTLARGEDVYVAELDTPRPGGRPAPGVSLG